MTGGSAGATCEPPGDGRLFHTDLGGGGGEILELLPGGDPLGRYLMAFGQDRKGHIYVLSSENFAPVGTTGLVQRLIGG